MKTGLALIDEIRSAEIQRGSLAFWWLGQLSFVVKTSEAIILLDPFLSPLERRSVPPLATPEEFANLASVISGSHDHLDHIDRPVLPRLLAANPQAKLVIPGAIDKIDELGAAPSQIVKMDDERVWTGAGCKITALKAAHEFFDRNERGYPHLSYVFESGDVRFLHTGDACVYDGLATRLSEWEFDLAFLPINGRDAVRFRRGCMGNMTYQEAADLAGVIRPGLTVPGHFEMFKNNSVEPQPFVDYMNIKHPGLRCMIPRHGELTLVEGS